MRPNGPLAAVLAVFFALSGGAVIAQSSQQGQASAGMSATETHALAERVFQAALADRLAAVIAAE